MSDKNDPNIKINFLSNVSYEEKIGSQKAKLEISNKDDKLEFKGKYEVGESKMEIPKLFKNTFIAKGNLGVYCGTETKFKEDGSIKKKVKFSAEMSDIPLPNGMTATVKVTDESAKVGGGWGNSESLYAGVYTEVNWEKGKISVGGELKFCKHFSTDLSAGYDLSKDILDLKLKLKAFGFELTFIDIEIKDLAHNTIGRCVDFVEDMYKSISPKEKEKQEKALMIKDIIDSNFNGIETLKETIKIVGENEKTISECSLYQIQRGVTKYIGHLGKKIDQNKIDIERHFDLVHNIGIRLDIQEGRIEKIENRLSSAEYTLSVHDLLLREHERRINKMETVFNIHENRLNEHDRILANQGSLLQRHTEILNYHSNILNQLDKKMNNIENNVILLKEGINLNSKIISNHEERIKNQQKDIQELFKITNYQKEEIKIQNENIFEHQKAIINLIYDYNYLKNKVENDEKIIMNLGETISKVINYATNTQNIVDGLCYISQLHDNLIIQNYNDIIKLKKEINNQRDYLIYRNEILKEMIKEINQQGIIVRLNDEKIKNLENFLKNVDKEIKNIYQEIPNLKKNIEYLKYEKEQIELRIQIDKKNDLIDEKIDELKEIINHFNKSKIAYFIKCVYISLCTGKFSFYKTGEIIEQIMKFNV